MIDKIDKASASRNIAAQRSSKKQADEFIASKKFSDMLNEIISMTAGASKAEDGYVKVSPDLVNSFIGIGGVNTKRHCELCANEVKPGEKYCEECAKMMARRAYGLRK